MGVLIVAELIALVLGMRTLSAVRGYVGGEGYWSKGQKDAVFALQRYAITQEEIYYKQFLDNLKIPLGDRLARLEVLKDDMDYEKAKSYYIAGNIHPDDVGAMITLVRYFGNFYYLKQVIGHWEGGDELIAELIQLGERIHLQLRDKKNIQIIDVKPMLEEIALLNTKLTLKEDAFSTTLGKASRWLENLLMLVLVFSILSIGGVVILTAYSYGREIMKSLAELNSAVVAVENGNLDQHVPVRSKDEIGQLSESLNRMFSSLKRQIKGREFAEQSEAKIKTLADTMPLIVYVADINGEMQFYNQRFWKFTGSPPMHPRDVDWQSYIHPEDVYMVSENFRIALERKKSFAAEYRIRGQEGSYRWFLGRAEPFFNQEGVATQWYGTATDIHEQRQSRLELQKAVKIRDEFLSIASHELKTPLTSLKLQVQIRQRYLDKGELNRFSPEKIKTMSDEDETQINRLIRLVDDMLDISRMASGKLVIRKENCDLVLLVKEIIHRFELQLLESKCSLNFEAPAEIVGHWDKFRIEQVIINLLTNAMKYGKGGMIFLKLSQENDVAIISVRDLGIGIQPRDLDRIFEQFERAISPSEVSGLGLGLYIAQEIVKSHNGTILVESEYGKGSTFTVKLPLFT